MWRLQWSLFPKQRMKQLFTKHWCSVRCYRESRNDLRCRRSYMEAHLDDVISYEGMLGTHRYWPVDSWNQCPQIWRAGLCWKWWKEKKISQLRFYIREVLLKKVAWNISTSTVIEEICTKTPYEQYSRNSFRQKKK